ncbi:hypothetical protein [Streptomyces rugosispiralis]|uniref:Uncharacterized protein n=1 Tax=Streptomyces rugosispiralis TaxID=2967341 RepID=A0ABT1UTZ8_9ACTN|nr:hypothetical protein [Streptomyces rugosispiralis]MCQ8188585.1 hypothetical protein [Streptomyces rugosispiralis]
MTGPLRIAGFTTAISGLIAPAAGRLRPSHPDLLVRVRMVCAAHGFSPRIVHAATHRSAV